MRATHGFWWVLFSGSSVMAGPADHRVEVDPLTPPEDYDDLLEEAAGNAPVDAESVRLVFPDGTDFEATLPEPPEVPTKAGEVAFRGLPVDHVGKTSGDLDGRAIYLSQCHGWTWIGSRFATQRGNVWDTVEDLHNPEAANQYLTAYLENAGASVYAVKERDLNPNLAIADNDGEGYAESGTGFEDGGAGFDDVRPVPYGMNPFEEGTTRRFPADGGGVASWIPEVPVDGRYAIYVSWRQSADNARSAHYRIRHPGGVIDRTFDQTVHGNTWQYVDTVWLEEGVASLEVELVGDSNESGRFLSADAVRIGGGTGLVERYGEVSERPRWEEAAIQAVQYNGAPVTVYDPDDTDTDYDGYDPSARSRWAAWEHPAGEDALYLSWHSNATESGNARGTVTYTYAGSLGPSVEGSVELAGAVQDELAASFQTLHDPDWYDRGLRTAAFAEVSPGHNDEMPAALVELAFHDNELDASYLKDPVFRRDASRAMYRGIVRYFAERDGRTPVFLPEPPRDLALLHDEGGALRLTFSPGESGAPFGDAAESYLIQTSSDGRAWSAGTPVDGTSTLLDTAPGERVFVRVVGLNEGGISFPSEVVGAMRSWDDEPAVLIVAAFDRLDTGLLDWEDIPYLGEVRRMNLAHMNPYDLVVAHGDAVGAAGWPFDAISDERLSDVDLSRYRMVVWGAGEESTADQTFDGPQREAIESYLESGGTLFVSGAEILWDLDYRGTDEERGWARRVLGSGMLEDAAGTTVAQGAGLLEQLDLSFGREHGGAYPVEWPDVLDSDWEVIAQYGTGTLAGVRGDRVALLGFPFETIGDWEARRAVFARILPELVPDYVAPEPVLGDTGEEDDGRRPLESGCGCSGISQGLGLSPLWLGMLLLRRRAGTRGEIDHVERSTT